MKTILFFILTLILPKHFVHLAKFVPSLFFLNHLAILSIRLVQEMCEYIFFELELVFSGKHVPIVKLEMIQVESFEERLEQLRVADQNVHDVMLCRQPLITCHRLNDRPKLRIARSR